MVILFMSNTFKAGWKDIKWNDHAIAKKEKDQRRNRKITVRKKERRQAKQFDTTKHGS